MDDSFLEAAFWFFGGVISHKFLDAMLNAGRNYVILQNTFLSSLEVLSFSEIHINSIQKTKYERLKELKFDQNEIEKIKEIDESVINFWKLMTLNGLTNSMPKNLRSAFKFNNWDAAMRYLKKNGK